MAERKLQSLDDYVDRKAMFCMNESADRPHTGLLGGGGSLESDDEPQFLLYVPFTAFVKLRAISMSSPSADVAPTIVKLFHNRDTITWDDAESDSPTQTLELTEEDTAKGGMPIMLRFVKFQRVYGIALFVEDNGGAETTILDTLHFFGEPVAGTDMSALKKSG
eukprot:PLAT15377.1.p1 GENE.PLAT15377.1~~PLAT15377.1.p1  ORF type:complete len:164 (+),score=61.01 PLAT15377.1:32-523(+)